MVESERVWESMAESFEGSEDPLAERLLSALDAAEARAATGAAARPAASRRPRRRASRGQREVDLRVDDHADPLGELRRLLRLRRAYNAMRGPPGPVGGRPRGAARARPPLGRGSSGPLRPASLDEAPRAAPSAARGRAALGRLRPAPSPTAELLPHARRAARRLEARQRQGHVRLGQDDLRRELAERLGVPYVELDALHHGPDWAEASAEELRARVRRGDGRSARRLGDRRQLRGQARRHADRRRPTRSSGSTCRSPLKLRRVAGGRASGSATTSSSGTATRRAGATRSGAASRSSPG